MNRTYSVVASRKRSVGVLVAVACGLSLALCPGYRASAQDAEAPSGEVAEQGIVMNFKDVSLDTVLAYLSEAAGLIVVQQVEVRGRVSILSLRPLNAEEAIALLNTVLKEQGYAAIRMGRTLKIVSLQDAKKASIPVRTGNDPDAIEPTDEVITQVIPVRYVDAVKLKDDLTPLIPSYAGLSANASSNALILTDTAANIRRIVEIVRALDTHLATVAEVKVFPLQYADASDAARLVNELFEEEQPVAQAGGFAGARARFFRGPGGQQAGAEQQAGPSQKVTAAADRRTNTVVISAPPDMMNVVATVVHELDANPTEEEAVLTYPLKNGRAENLAKVLNDLFQQSAQTATGATAAQRRQTAQAQRAGRGTQQDSQAAAAAAGLSGQVYVVADADTNALLVMTASKNFERVKEIIAQLDRAIPQVLIKVLIAEVTHDRTLDLGLEFSILNLRPSERGGELFTDFDVADFEAADLTGGLVMKLLEKDVTATLRALDAVGKLDVLSRPYILTSDNQPATITVGQEVPFIRQTRTTETGQTINTIEYEDIGIILKVTPHINPDGLVIMDIAPEISTVTAVTVPISEGVEAPVYAKRSAESRVGILDGQTIVIGGLVEDQKTEDVSKIPLLGDIPLLGRLFSRTVKKTGKTELLIFLTPHVAPEAEALKAISEGERAGSKAVSGAVEPGAFEEHMKGMQRGKNPADGR